MKCKFACALAVPVHIEKNDPLLRDLLDFCVQTTDTGNRVSEFLFYQCNTFDVYYHVTWLIRILQSTV